MKQLAFGCALAGILPLAHGDVTGPFAVQNQNPFVSLYGLPRYGEARVLGAGRSSLDVSYSVASSFDGDGNGVEQAVLDGESERWGVRYLRGLGDGWELGVDVPYLRHRGGYLDQLIVDWHDAFGLPQNGRDSAPNGRLSYAYSAPGATIALSNSVGGLGDVQLLLGKALVANDRARLAWRTHLKLPTGDADDLLGSGGTDLSTTLHYGRALTAQWTLGASVGATLLDDGDVLAERVRPLVGHLGAFVNFAPNETLLLTLQWDVHSQVYEETRLRQLNEIAYLLSFGARLRFDAGELTFAVVENYPHPEVSPDVAFHLGWRWSMP